MKSQLEQLKMLPDVLCWLGLVQFKYVQDIMEPNDTNFKG